MQTVSIVSITIEVLSSRPCRRSSIRRRNNGKIENFDFVTMCKLLFHYLCYNRYCSIPVGVVQGVNFPLIMTRFYDAKLLFYGFLTRFHESLNCYLYPGPNQLMKGHQASSFKLRYTLLKNYSHKNAQEAICHQRDSNPGS